MKTQKESANVVKPENNKTPFDLPEDANTKQSSYNSMLQNLQHELDKIKDKISNDAHSVNIAHISNFAGGIQDPNQGEFSGIISSLQTIIIALNASLKVSKKVKPNSWVIDTGATTHMCANPDYFTNFHNASYPTIINLPDGSNKNVTHTGDVNLTPKIALKDTLFTPYFKFNLISVSKLVETAHMRFIFYPTYCIFQDLRTKEILVRGRVINSLYVLESYNLDDIACNDLIVSLKNACNDLVLPLNNTAINESSGNSESRCNSHCDYMMKCNKLLKQYKEPNSVNSTLHANNPSHIHTWHRRLAHVFYNALQHINIPGLSTFGTVNNIFDTCEICHKSKQCRLPFPLSTSRTTSTFELLHADIWGPYSQHLLQLARSLMLQVNLPKHFWPYSLLLATYIVNRLLLLSCTRKRLMRFYMVNRLITLV